MLKRVLYKKQSKDLAGAPTQVKRVLLRKITSSLLPVPGIPEPGVHMTKTMEAFEALREYYTLRKIDIPQDDIKWYLEELQREKKEFDAFWERCLITKVIAEGIFRGDDDWTIALAENEARQKVKALPIQESDIGPMPEYGTKDFWSWCHKRKKLKEQKQNASASNIKKVMVH